MVFAHANVAKNGLLIFHFLHLLISLLSIASKKIHAFCTLFLFLFDVVMQIFFGVFCTVLTIDCRCCIMYKNVTEKSVVKWRKQ